MRVITLPNGKQVRLSVYCAAWRTLKTLDPSEERKGWEWYPVKAGLILRRISEGVHDRVNKRGGLVVRELSDNRLHRLIRKRRAD